MTMPLQLQEKTTSPGKEKARHARGKMILVVGLIMIVLFFGLFLSLMTVTLTSMQ